MAQRERLIRAKVPELVAAGARGPSPFHFVTLPDDESAAIHSLANEVTYGWGMIPVRAQIGKPRGAR